MPYLKEGFTSIETAVPERWINKMEAVKEKKGMSSRRQYIRDLIYDDLKKEEEL